jgi:hypothetical protein
MVLSESGREGGLTRRVVMTKESSNDKDGDILERMQLLLQKPLLLQGFVETSSLCYTRERGLLHGHSAIPAVPPWAICEVAGFLLSFVRNPPQNKKRVDPETNKQSKSVNNLFNKCRHGTG